MSTAFSNRFGRIQRPKSLVMAGMRSLMALRRVAVLGRAEVMPFNTFIALRPRLSLSGS